MSPEDVKILLENTLFDCEFQVATDGGHFNIVAIGEIFTNKRPVQRQQVIYGALGEQISSGEIHAVNIKTFTREEWNSRS
jgi:acid stress-induced BolA-like protein IbaG/YrbA